MKTVIFKAVSAFVFLRSSILPVAAFHQFDKLLYQIDRFSLTEDIESGILKTEKYSISQEEGLIS